ncbi:MAG TPA: T9SS type A sorting domain-containing protein, partial [Saprospiraceae bacterium]
PNPVESWLDISDPDQMVVEVKVYDFMGRQIYRVEELNINMESAPQGYYMVVFKLKSGQYIAQKILKI